jgi:putative membrane protein
MQIFLILALIIALIAVIFALQNTVTVAISFLFWQLHGSLALVLIVSLVAGALITSLVLLPGLLHGRWTLRKQRKQIAELESSLNEHKQRLSEADHRLEQSTAAQPQESEQKLVDQPSTHT